MTPSVKLSNPSALRQEAGIGSGQLHPIETAHITGLFFPPRSEDAWEATLKQKGEVISCTTLNYVEQRPDQIKGLKKKKNDQLSVNCRRHRRADSDSAPPFHPVTRRRHPDATLEYRGQVAL